MTGAGTIITTTGTAITMTTGMTTITTTGTTTTDANSTKKQKKARTAICAGQIQSERVGGDSRIIPPLYDRQMTIPADLRTQSTAISETGAARDAHAPPLN
jgi:hypothetical protein